MQGFLQFGRWLLFSLIILVLTGLNPARSSSVKEVGLGEMAAASELVFEGRVLEVASRWSDDGSAIRTYVTFDVLEVLKGSAGAMVTLSFLGGAVRDLHLNITDSNVPVPGEKGVYFVEDSRREQVNPIYGWSQGHFLLVRDPAGGGELVLTSDARPVMAIDRGGARAKSAGISDGVAGGVVIGEESVVGRAMTRSSFLENLRELVFQADA